MIAIDDRDPRCVVVTWPSRAVGIDELERFAREVIVRLERASGRCAVLVDVRHAAPLEARAMARLPEIDRRVCASANLAARAIVAPGGIAERVVAWTIAVSRPAVPTRAFTDLASAQRWLAEH